ncbi:hypothetical protein BJ875DRAFT_379067 [Amylocarpus encephaloides]|uniref:Uncharacterized protein n=1 Tax=Amylocarpus encephaloides TaxID=45428 RepID=A0A9P7YGR7_9HELO|nr:hypothetical protein BJ875DRAFT_379067 [Amylocarpus encephaloides]
MISRGCQWQVQDEQPLSPASDSKVSEDEEVDTPISSTETVTDGYPHFDSFHIPDQLSKEALLEKIFIVCQSDQDSEFNTYHTVWDLFRDQSSRWSVLAENHVETIRNAICTFLEVALEALTDSSSYNAILVDVVNPAMDKAEADALHILGQILAPSGQVAPSWFKSKLIRSIEQNELQKKVEDVSQAMRQLSNNHESADFDKKILSKVLLMTNEADHQPDFGSISLDDIICYLEIFYQVCINSTSAPRPHPLFA